MAKKKSVLGLNSFKGEIRICNAEKDERYKFFVRRDSASVSVKLYTGIGVKIAEIITSGDTSFVKNAFNSDIETQIQFYLNKYHASLCLDSMITDLFSYKIFMHPSVCYQLEKVSDADNRIFYNIYSLKQERLFSVERASDTSSEDLSFRVFNESMCIEVYLK